MGVIKESRVQGGRYKMIKKAQFSQMNIISYIVVAFLFVVFCAGLIYVSGLLNDVFYQVGIANEVNSGADIYVNLTEAGEQIWGNHYQAIQALRMVSFVYLLVLGIGIVIIGFLERKHPFLFFVYILIVLLGIIFAPTVSNAYEELLSSGIFGGELVNFTASNFILLNLPTIIMIIGILGGFGLFVNLIRSGGEGEIR